jgi:uncharacterized membrane protein
VGHFDPYRRASGVSGEYLLLKWAHIVSSTVLFGMGAGIAFFFVRAQRTRDVIVIAAVSRDVVLADAIFTAVAIVIQPVTGIAMLRMAGYPWTPPWIIVSIILYALIGLFWLPVVWLQIRMRDMAALARSTGTELSPAYFRCYRWWFVLGWPAFSGVLFVFYLMVAKPMLWRA